MDKNSTHQSDYQSYYCWFDNIMTFWSLQNRDICEVKTRKEPIVSLRNELSRDLDTLSSKLDKEKQLFERDCKKFGSEPVSVDSFTERQYNIERQISAYEEVIELINKNVRQVRRPDDFDDLDRAEIAAFLEDEKRRLAHLKKALIKQQARLIEAQTRQSFMRDAGEMELWLFKRVTDLLDENYQDLEAELRTKAERVQAVLKLGNQLIQGRQCFGQEEAVKKRLQRIADLIELLTDFAKFTQEQRQAQAAFNSNSAYDCIQQQLSRLETATRKIILRLRYIRELHANLCEELHLFNALDAKNEREILAFNMRSLGDKDEERREKLRLVSHHLFGTDCFNQPDANKTTDVYFLPQQESTSRNSCAYASHLKQNAKNVEKSTQHTKISQCPASWKTHFFTNTCNEIQQHNVDSSANTCKDAPFPFILQSVQDKETQSCATKNQINFNENFICNVLTQTHRRRQSIVQQLLAVENVSDAISRRLSIQTAQEHDLPAPRAGDALNPWQLPYHRFTSQDARRQSFNAQPDHDALQRFHGGYTIFRQQTRGDVADALAAAGFFTQLGNGRAHCFACNRLLEYSEAYSTRDMDLYALHEPDCAFMRSQLGSFYVQVRLEADRTTQHFYLSELLTHFLAANDSRFPSLAPRILRLDGLPIMQLLPVHFSRVPGHQPYQRDMPNYWQLRLFIEDLHKQFGQLLSTYQEVLSEFSVQLLQYVVLIVTQAGHRETCGREVLEFARYMHYRMRQLGRSDMDSFVRDCLRDLECSNVEEIVRQNLTPSYEDLAIMHAQLFPLLVAILAGDAQPDFGQVEQDNLGYAAENCQVQNFFG